LFLPDFDFFPQRMIETPYATEALLSRFLTYEDELVPPQWFLFPFGQTFFAIDFFPPLLGFANASRPYFFSSFLLRITPSFPVVRSPPTREDALLPQACLSSKDSG